MDTVWWVGILARVFFVGLIVYAFFQAIIHRSN